MNLINELVKEVAAESNHTMVRSQRLEIARAIARGIYVSQGTNAQAHQILRESDNILVGNEDAIE